MIFPKNRIFLLILLSFFSLPAAAARSDNSQPVEIEADQGNFAQNNMQTEFSGNVIVRQGSLNIHADKIRAQRAPDGTRLTATGKPVRFRQSLDEKRADGTPQLIQGQADKVTFDSAKSQIVLSGKARVEREGDVVSGAVITYNTATSVYSVNSAGSGRVSVILQPTTVQGGK